MMIGSRFLIKRGILSPVAMISSGGSKGEAGEARVWHDKYLLMGDM